MTLAPSPLIEGVGEYLRASSLWLLHKLQDAQVRGVAWTNTLAAL
jgi:hypothetical protein